MPGRRARLSQRAGRVLVLAALLGGTGVALPGAGGMASAAPARSSATPSGSTGTVPVPVLGRTTIHADRRDQNAVVTALVHGVRRVPGGTVLYYSMGVPAGSSGEGVNIFGVTSNRALRTRIRAGSTPLGSQLLVDVKAKQVYSTLIDADRQALASPRESFGEEPGKLYVYYQVLPELPASTTTVDVALGHLDVVPGVAVQDGLLEPAQPQLGPIELGRPWPAVDLAAVEASPSPEQGIFTWRTAITDLTGSLTTREQPDQVSVDLAADVLFAVDRATLTSKAAATIRKAATTVNERAAAGTIRVVGHTDSSASDAYNDALSRRRAAAVRRALAPLVSADGVRFAVEGRGEREPVRSNSTPAGRQANRRVSITFTPKDAG